MNTDIPGCRTRLEDELRETVAAIAQASQSTETVELDQPSVGRLSHIGALQQQALAKGVLERRDLRRRQLEAAPQCPC